MLSRLVQARARGTLGAVRLAILRIDREDALQPSALLPRRAPSDASEPKPRYKTGAGTSHRTSPSRPPIPHPPPDRSRRPEKRRHRLPHRPRRRASRRLFLAWLPSPRNICEGERFLLADQDRGQPRARSRHGSAPLGSWLAGCSNLGAPEHSLSREPNPTPRAISDEHVLNAHGAPTIPRTARLNSCRNSGTSRARSRSMSTNAVRIRISLPGTRNQRSPTPRTLG